MWVQSKNSGITSVSKAGYPSSYSVKRNGITDKDAENQAKKQKEPSFSVQSFRFTDEIAADVMQNTATRPASRSYPQQQASVHQASTPIENSHPNTWDDADIDAPLPPSIWQRRRSKADVAAPPDAVAPWRSTKQQVGHLQQRFAVALFGFAAVYLLGCAAAGVLYHCFGTTEMDYLNYYLGYFMDAICTGTVVNRTLQLCSVSLLSLTAVLLCGLSALGLPLLFMFLFLKGVGSGTLVLAFFAQYQWLGLVYYLATAGIAEAFLGTCLCALAVHAANNTHLVLGKAVDTQGQATILQTGRLGRRYGALLLFMFAICALCSVVAHFVFG